MNSLPRERLNPSMDTSQNINHAFGCSGEIVHVTPGYMLLRAGNINRCPQCGAEVKDITDTLLGQSYLAFARLDLGTQL
ncbi:MAG TPA: hypothetical protein VJ785_01050 [Anaerolineales bacterium]|nr:hypothetical protein [Anaerolineales bacterium]